MSFTNAQLATQIAALIEYWSAFNEEYSDWIGGTVSGGPNTDGEYPLTNWAGEETLLPCPAKLSDNVSGYVATVDASATAAAASAVAASDSEIAAAASAVTATAQAVLADADRIAAELAETGAVDAKVTAIAQAAAAVVSAAAALASEVAAAASEAAAAISETNAAASAAAAATFDPALYAALADAETITGAWEVLTPINSGSATFDLVEQGSFNTALGYGFRMEYDAATNVFYMKSCNTTTVNTRMSISRDTGAVSLPGAVTAGSLESTGTMLVQGNTVSSALIANWNTAYGWGDHASGGYQTDIGLTDDGNQFGYSSIAPFLKLTETGVTGTPVWWIGGDSGNFAIRLNNGAPYGIQFNTDASNATITSVSIPTSLSVTGTVTGSNLNVSNWDTAYGWGDHSTQNYAATTGDTFTGDISISGVSLKGTFGSTDADLDMFSAYAGLSLHQLASTASNIPASLNNANAILAIATHEGTGVGYGHQLYFNSNNEINHRVASNGVWGSWYKLWTSQNFTDNSANWDTAYGWGDHAAAGYAAASSLSNYLPLAGGTMTGDLIGTGAAFNAGGNPGIDTYKPNRFWQGYVTTTDVGTFPQNYVYVANIGNPANSSPARGIQLATSYGSYNDGFWVRRGSDNASSENGANVWQNWRELVTTTHAGYNKSNWDTAYGWGNHASAGYQSASTAIETEDNATLNTLTLTPDTTTDSWGLRLESSNSALNDSGFWATSNSWRLLLRDAAGNLDVDLNPGGTSFLTGPLSLSSDLSITSSSTDGIKITGESPSIHFVDNSAAADDDFWVHVNSSNFYVLADRTQTGSWATPHPLQLAADTNIGYCFGNRIATTSESLSISGLYTFTHANGIQINDSNTRVDEGTGNAIRLQTDSGYIDIGPQNTSYAHFQTDRATFYMNKPLSIDGQPKRHSKGAIPYYDSTSYASGKITVSSTAPVSPSQGDIWFDTT